MKRNTALLAALAVVVAACTGITTTSPTDSTVQRQPQADGSVLVGGYFQEFTSCDSLLDYYISHAIEIVGPWGLGGGGYWGGRFGVEEMASSDAAMAPASGASFARSEGYTTSNVQVQGVDEADIVKTDGKRIFMTADTGLKVAVVTGEGVEFTDSLSLDWYPQSMMLYEDTLVLMGMVWGQDVYLDSFYYGGGSGTTKIVEVDVSDPSDVKVKRTLEFDGSYVSARLVNSELRVAVNSTPVGLDFEQPQGSGLRAERDATEANIAVIKASTLDNWLPYYVLENGSSESEGRLLDCSGVMAPTTFSGVDTLSLLTFDLRGQGVADWDSAGVVASGATMYANHDRTYLSTARWQNWAVLAEDDARSEAEEFTTDIHVFDSSNGAPAYLGSGTVKGFLLNQFAMDEFDGHLRVASTTTPNWWGWGGSSDSQSQVTVFEVTGGDLEQVGFVDGLGKTEQIYSVRFMGDTAYVVTFRQTDPLYVLDLSDVTDPTVTGELKIPGYSAYLHPAGEGRLLGVGQAGDEDGRTQGTQVSLFDVSDPNDPKLLDAVMIENAWSAVEGDHLAFTMTEGVAYVPFEAWTWDETNNGEGTETFDIGVMAVTVGTDSLELTSILRPVADGPIDWNDKIFEEKGIAPDPWRMSARRTIRIDDRVYLITNGGIAIFELDGFERVGYTEFK